MVKRLNQIGLNCYLDAKFKDALLYLNWSLKVSINIGYDRGEAISNTLLSSVVFQQSNFIKSMNHSLRALEIYSDISDTTCTNFISNLNNIATIYKQSGLYSNSLKFYLRALVISEKTNNHFVTLMQSNIGCLYKDKGDYDKSIDYYNKILISSKKDNDTLNVYPNAYMGLADLFYSKNNLDKSLQYYNKFLKISQYVGDSSYICSANTGIANVLKSKGNYDEAINYLKLSLMFNDVERNSESHLYLGQIYITHKKYNLAYSELNKSLSLAKSIGFKNLICSAYKQFYKLDSITNNCTGSIINYKLYMAYTDSLNNIESEKKMVAHELNYEFNKEKSVFKSEAETQSNKQKSIIIIVILVLLVVLAFAFVIYKSYLGKNKAHKLITYQKHLVDEKQKEILDNITYAKRIQSAVLPSQDYIDEHAKNNFVFYKPKDIVSGDFYWASKRKDNFRDKFYIAVADCTGHGVSGSMMSMLNISILNELVDERGIEDTGQILTDARKEIVKSLNPKGNENVSDGMDCVLCAFDFNKKTLQYSAANNSFYIIRNKEIIVCKADKMPIGLGIKNEPFKSTTIDLMDGDVVYMFTDGYADQFGGEQNKKFRYKQLEELLLSLCDRSMEKQKEALSTSFDYWKGHHEQTDDVLLIGVKI